MARRKRMVLEEMEQGQEELETGGLIEVPPHDEEVEASRVMEMMQAVANDEPEKITLYLHKANEKNRSVSGAFASIYSSDVPFGEIQREARDLYGGGDFVLIARKGNGFFNKSIFSTVVNPEGVKGPLAPGQHVPLDQSPQFARLTASMEKRLVLDKLQEMAEGKGGKGDSESIMAMFMKNTLETNAMLMQMLLEKKNEAPPRTSIQDLSEMARFVKDLSAGKFPDEEDDSLTGIVKQLLPVIAEFARSRGIAPGAMPSPPGPGSAPPALGAMDPLILRVLAETRFCLGRPESPDLFSHLADYTETYIPGTIDSMLKISEDDYLKYIFSMDPAFQPREEFFRKLHRHIRENYGEEVLPAAPAMMSCPECKAMGIVLNEEGNAHMQCPKCLGKQFIPKEVLPS